jgi:outer membrane protein TolC
VPEVNVGVTARNEVGDDIGHEWVVGPSLSIELPIFNPGHADIARIQAYLRQAEHRQQDLAIMVRSEIRVHRAELVAARRKVEYYQQKVLPRAESITELTLQQYNAMQLGTYQLLETRSDQLDAHQEYVEALRDYWIARSELELAVGGRRDPRAPLNLDVRAGWHRYHHSADGQNATNPGSTHAGVSTAGSWNVRRESSQRRDPRP